MAGKTKNKNKKQRNEKKKNPRREIICQKEIRGNARKFLKTTSMLS